MTFAEQDYFISLALDQAHKARELGEVPVGAVIIDEFGKIVSKAFNTKERDQDPSAHAELLAIKMACEKIKNWRLTNHHLFVTLEPCPMCFSLIMQARLKSLSFGAYDPKGGALSRGYHFHLDQKRNHSIDIIGGLKQFECSKVLSDFFRYRRTEYKHKKSN